MQVSDSREQAQAVGIERCEPLVGNDPRPVTRGLLVHIADGIMKRQTLLLFVIAFWCLPARQAVSCPHCNIHNLLAESVQESTDVFRGEVLRPVGRYRAEVKVLNVFRGTHEVGSTVTTRVFRLKWHVGDKFVFCETNSISGTFGTLDLEIEDEILFLVQGKPDIRSMEEAIQRVQGVSVETQKKGMEYIADHHAAALKPLITELNSLMPQVFSNEEVFFGEHRLARSTLAQAHGRRERLRVLPI